jgi:hypothetical protein
MDETLRYQKVWLRLCSRRRTLLVRIHGPCNASSIHGWMLESSTNSRSQYLRCCCWPFDALYSIMQRLSVFQPTLGDSVATGLQTAAVECGTAHMKQYQHVQLLQHQQQHTAAHEHTLPALQYHSGVVQISWAGLGLAASLILVQCTVSAR